MKLGTDTRSTGMAPVVALHSADGGDDVGIRVEEAADCYVRARLGRGELTVESAHKARATIRLWVSVVGDKQLRKLDRRDAEAFMAAISDRAPATRALYWSYLNVFCEWCVDEEWLIRNPFRRVKPPKPPRRQPRDLPADAVARVLREAERQDTVRGRLIVLLMVQQGLRCAGVAGLRREDVDLESRWMRVKEKGGHERSLWITDECYEAMVEYLDRYPCTEGPLIRAWKNPGTRCAGDREFTVTDRPLVAGTVSRWVSGWMYGAGVKRSARDGVGAHALRHTCATDMLDGGAAITDVQATLGHSSVATTMVYTHVRPQRLAGAMEGRRYSEAVGA